MKIKHPILVVDDEVEMRIAMSATLKRCNLPVELSHNAIDALNKIKKKEYGLVITDMTMPKRSGVELLKDIKSIRPATQVIIMTAHGTVETAVESMKHGAFDYILKPFDFQTVIFLIERALTNRPLVQIGQGSGTSPLKVKNDKNAGGASADETKEIVTQDAEMKELLEMAKSISNSKATILVQSESGTGKELLAKYIHDSSNRKDKPFVAVNCAALPETLLESELFGHKKGSFTGAINDHKGKFELANEGTILLDEISEMALALQAKLLRVLQEFKVDRIGGAESIPIDVRVIATTNRNLMEYVEENKFREDLFFRLNVIPLQLPPLRKRKGDVNLLADYFVEKYCKQNELPAKQLNEDTLRVLNNYNWRGNVRELENVIERAVLLSGESEIKPENLLINPVSVSKNKAASSAENKAETIEWKVGQSLTEVERQVIEKTLATHGGDTKKTAKALGITPSALAKKISQLNLAT